MALREEGLRRCDGQASSACHERSLSLSPLHARLAALRHLLAVGQHSYLLVEEGERRLGEGVWEAGRAAGRRRRQEPAWSSPLEAPLAS